MNKDFVLFSRTWNGFAIESKEYSGNVIHLDQTSGDVTLRVIDNSTMEQLIGLNDQGELHNQEFQKYITIESDKVISSEIPSSKWEIGNIHSILKI